MTDLGNRIHAETIPEETSCRSELRKVCSPRVISDFCTEITAIGARSGAVLRSPV